MKDNSNRCKCTPSRDWFVAAADAAGLAVNLSWCHYYQLRVTQKGSTLNVGIFALKAWALEASVLT